MKKLSYLLLLFLFVFSGNVYSQITVLNGNQVVNGLTVTVSRSNPAPNSATLCATGPYQIGRNYSDWYKYEFIGQPASHFTVQMIRLHDDDTVQVIVNGQPYNVTGAVAYLGDPACNITSNNVNFPGNGYITTTGGATGVGQGIEFEISLPGKMIDSVRIMHIRAAANAIASDVIYAADCKLDTCGMKFIAERGPKICEGYDLQLTATEYPNTTYKWTPATGVIPPVFDPSDNVREPIMKNIGAINSGTYIVTGLRGDCVYRDEINLSISTAPSLGGVVKQLGPLCPGGDDTMSVPQVSLPTGGKVYAWGQSQSVLYELDANNGYGLPFPSVTGNERGLYSVYAVDVQGCITDTIDFFFDVLTGVHADFNYTIKEGCVQDTVIFMNTSIGNQTQVWDFGDQSPLATEESPEHYYIVPKPHNDARKYIINLKIANTSCGDTVEKEIDIDHRLAAEFTMDDDSICQGGTIAFTDISEIKAGTIPTRMWSYGYTDPVQQNVLNHTFTYDKAGIYNPKMIITDYLGCVDSYSLELVVDSTGGITFTTDKENVCIGDEVTFTGDYYKDGALSATWDFKDGVNIPGDEKVYHSYVEQGTYDVSYAVDYRICPDIIVTKGIVVKPVPQVYLGEDTSICPNGKPIYIGDVFNQSGNGIKYTWNTTERDATQGIYVHSPGTYAVTAEQDGCSASDTLVVKKNCYIDIPNVFTPNGDGKSDYFLPRQLLSKNVSEFSMQIYNRWGQQVFVTTSTNGRGWDGKMNGEEQPIGVYVYTIQVTFGNGITERYQGNVTLLR